MIDSASEPAAVVTLNEGDAWTFTLRLLRATRPFTWRFDESPAGLSLDSQLGVLQWLGASPFGSPHAVVVMAENALGSDSVSFSIVVRASELFVVAGGLQLRSE